MDKAALIMLAVNQLIVNWIELMNDRCSPERVSKAQDRLESLLREHLP